MHPEAVLRPTDENQGGQSMSGIPARDLRQVLESVRVALENPQLTARLLALCERNELAAARYREAEAELALERTAHQRRLAEMSEASREQIEREKAEWQLELAQARRELEKERGDLQRRRAWAEKQQRLAPASESLALAEAGAVRAEPATAGA
jgi:hypothetical protein